MSSARIRATGWWVIAAICMMASACTHKQLPGEEILRRFAADDLTGVISRDAVVVDTLNPAEGSGALRIDATAPLTVPLYEVQGLDVDNVRLFYRARVRTENVQGRAYLEMWCHFPGRGEFFARDLMSPVSRTSDWAAEETMFMLKEGEKPDYVKLNFVIDGTGTAWIDDVRLATAPL